MATHDDAQGVPITFDRSLIGRIRQPTGSRLTVTGSISHQVMNEQPTMLAPIRYSVSLASEERPYERSLKAGTAWQALDPDGRLWVERAALLVIENQSPERESIVLELGLQPLDGPCLPFAYLHSGRPLPLVPADLKSLRVRASSATCRYLLTVVSEV